MAGSGDGSNPVGGRGRFLVVDSSGGVREWFRFPWATCTVILVCIFGENVRLAPFLAYAEGDVGLARGTSVRLRGGSSIP